MKTFEVKSGTLKTTIEAASPIMAIHQALINHIHANGGALGQLISAHDMEHKQSGEDVYIATESVLKSFGVMSESR